MKELTAKEVQILEVVYDAFGGACLERQLLAFSDVSHDDIDELGIYDPFASVKNRVARGVCLICRVTDCFAVHRYHAGFSRFSTLTSCKKPDCRKKFIDPHTVILSRLCARVKSEYFVLMC